MLRTDGTSLGYNGIVKGADDGSRLLELALLDAVGLSLDIGDW
jgi:hypothetical protein